MHAKWVGTVHITTEETKQESKKKNQSTPLLEPSSPSKTLMDDIICSAAGGDMEVA